eukprot:Gregarina_sp_Poly_1__11167@NODE_90_length_14949_cov_249_160328_g77_i0_p1_GENE_NODE_90_length_14949_cov_249_160328_g77_i0NODE_90_length_14949_cov_249_160328_g77_i0_p1_ORF_typecomplete_len1542_score315_02Lipase_chap/PF03280_14/0_0018_NODE_90_length_14949_cov_249_160328_g77_i03484628
MEGGWCRPPSANSIMYNPASFGGLLCQETVAGPSERNELTSEPSSNAPGVAPTRELQSWLNDIFAPSLTISPAQKNPTLHQLNQFSTATSPPALGSPILPTPQVKSRFDPSHPLDERDSHRSMSPPLFHSVAPLQESPHPSSERIQFDRNVPEAHSDNLVFPSLARPPFEVASIGSVSPESLRDPCSEDLYQHLFQYERTEVRDPVCPEEKRPNELAVAHEEFLRCYKSNRPRGRPFGRRPPPRGHEPLASTLCPAAISPVTAAPLTPSPPGVAGHASSTQAPAESSVRDIMDNAVNLGKKLLQVIEGRATKFTNGLVSTPPRPQEAASPESPPRAYGSPQYLQSSMSPTALYLPPGTTVKFVRKRDNSSATESPQDERDVSWARAVDQFVSPEQSVEEGACETISPEESATWMTRTSGRQRSAFLEQQNEETSFPGAPLSTTSFSAAAALEAEFAELRHDAESSADEEETVLRETEPEVEQIPVPSIPRFSRPMVTATSVTRKKKVEGIPVIVDGETAAPEERHVVTLMWAEIGDARDRDDDWRIWQELAQKQSRRAGGLTREEAWSLSPLVVWHELRGCYNRLGAPAVWNVWYSGVEHSATLVFSTTGKYTLELSSASAEVSGSIHVTQLAIPMEGSSGGRLAGGEGGANVSRQVKKMRADLKAEVDQFRRCVQLLGPLPLKAFDRVRRRRAVRGHSTETASLSGRQALEWVTDLREDMLGDDCFAPLFRRADLLDLSRLASKRLLTESDLDAKVAALHRARSRGECYSQLPADLRRDVEAMLEVVDAYKRRREEDRGWKHLVDIVMQAQTSPLNTLMFSLEKAESEVSEATKAAQFDAAFEELIAGDSPFGRLVEWARQSPKALAEHTCESSWEEMRSVAAFETCLRDYAALEARYKMFLPKLLRFLKQHTGGDGDAVGGDGDASTHETCRALLEEIQQKAAATADWLSGLRTLVETHPLPTVLFLTAQRKDNTLFFGSLDRTARATFPQKIATDLLKSAKPGKGARKPLLPAVKPKLAPSLHLRALKLYWLGCQRWYWILTNIIEPTAANLAVSLEVPSDSNFNATETTSLPVRDALSMGQRRLLQQVHRELRDLIFRVGTKLRNLANLDPEPLPLPALETATLEALPRQTTMPAASRARTPSGVASELPTSNPLPEGVVEVLEGFNSGGFARAKRRDVPRRRSHSRRRRSVSGDGARAPLPALPQLGYETLVKAAVKLEPLQANPARQPDVHRASPQPRETPSPPQALPPRCTPSVVKHASLPEGENMRHRGRRDRLRSWAPPAQTSASRVRSQSPVLLEACRSFPRVQSPAREPSLAREPSPARNVPAEAAPTKSPDSPKTKVTHAVDPEDSLPPGFEYFDPVSPPPFTPPVPESGAVDEKEGELRNGSERCSLVPKELIAAIDKDVNDAHLAELKRRYS